MEATEDPFSYLFINLTQECQPQVKYLSKLFYYDHSVRVYRLDKSSKMKGATICAEMSLVVNVYFNKADNKNYISVINSEMSLVVNVFFNKADNKNYISVIISYSVGKEILGAKANECQECDSP